MRRNVILPLIGTGEIRLGIDREELRRTHAGEFVMAFRRDTTEADDFGKFFAYYGDDGRITALEFTEPGELYLEEAQLLGADAEECRRLFESLDPALELEAQIGFTSRKLQIGVYAPCGVVESVCIGGEGYYR